MRSKKCLSISLIALGFTLAARSTAVIKIDDTNCGYDRGFTYGAFSVQVAKTALGHASNLCYTLGFPGMGKKYQQQEQHCGDPGDACQAAYNALLALAPPGLGYSCQNTSQGSSDQLPCIITPSTKPITTFPTKISVGPTLCGPMQIAFTPTNISLTISPQLTTPSDVQSLNPSSPITCQSNTTCNFSWNTSASASCPPDLYSVTFNLAIPESK